MQQKLTKVTFALGLSVFILAFLGLFHPGMSMNSDGAMEHCPFSLGSTVCTMSPVDHIAAAQHFLTALPQQKNLVALLLLLFTLIALALFASLYKELLSLRRRSHVPIQCVPVFSARTFLEEIFSQGILNPKLF